MEIRPIHNSEMGALLQKWPSIFGEELSEEMFARILLCDENYDSNAFLVAVDQNNILGFIIGIKRKVPYLNRGMEENKAWVLAIGVLKEHRNQGIGTKLMEHIHEYYQNNTKTIVLGAYSPFYFFPAVEDNPVTVAFFTKFGFQKEERSYGMHKDLVNYSIPTDVQEKKTVFEKEGFKFMPFTFTETIPLLQLVKQEFSVGWYRNLCNAISFGIAPQTVLLVKKGEEVVGYIQRRYDFDPCRFGPFGIKEKYRSIGLGRIMLHCCWSAMKEEGESIAYFKTTNDQALPFYLRNGMIIDKTMWHMAGEISTWK